MKRKIRRAFENITPNVLKSVLGQVQRPEQAKSKPKKIIPWKQYLTTAAAVLLLFAVGYGGAAILTGGESGIGVSKPQQPTGTGKSNYLSRKEVYDIAFAELCANEKRDDLTLLDGKIYLFEADEGEYYNVELRFDDSYYTSRVTYMYTIHPETGFIEDFFVTGGRILSNITTPVSWQAARDTALNHAGISIETLTGLEIECTEDGIYTIDFRDQVYEYEYKIDSLGNRVLRRELDDDDDRDSVLSAYQPRQYSVKTALDYARVSYEDLYFLESSSDYKSFPKTRTVSFVANDKPYEFTLLMDTHAIVSTNIDVPEELISKITALRAAVSASHMPIIVDQISDIYIEFTDENGTSVYEIEITANGVEWEAIVDAKTGALRRLEKEAGDHDTPTQGFTNIALGSKNISKLDLSYLETEYNEKKNCYDVTFTLDNVTNTISVFEQEKEPDTQETEPPATEKPTEPKQPDLVVIPDKTIGAEGAITAALADLKIDRSNVMYEYVTLEEDDGVAYYEVQFLYKGFLYECDVNFVSGKVTDWDKEEIEPDEVEMNLSKSLDKEIRDAFYKNQIPGNIINFHNSDELTVEYYGEYDDAHVVMVNGILSYDDGSVTRNVAGITFTFPTSQELLVYEDGKFINLEFAYENDILDYEDIVYLHMNYTK